MPKINLGDMDNYKTGEGGNSFFRLTEDKEKKRVRFLIESEEDLNNYLYVVHKCPTSENKYGVDVNCLREYEDPIEDCPLCAAGYKREVRICVPVYNIDDECIQIWSRGKQFIAQLQALLENYDNLPGNIFIIQRSGKKGDQKTTYSVIHKKDDDVELDELLEEIGELPEIEGMAIRNCSEEDMEYYLESGEFPPNEEDDDDDIPSRKRKKKKSSKNDEDEDIRPRHKRHSKPKDEDEEEDDEDDEDDEEEERPVRRSKVKSRDKKKRHRPADEF